MTPVPVVVTGRRRRLTIDNLLYCDGSARPTRAYGMMNFAAQQEPWKGLNLNAQTAQWVRRGPKRRLTVEPTPGARIRGNMQTLAGVNASYWPFKGHQNLITN